MQDNALEHILTRFAPIVLDTGLLYEYIKALHFPDKVENLFDATVLKMVLPQFAKIYITPHVFAELNGLATRDFGNNRKIFLEKAKQVLVTLFEEYVEKDKIILHDDFIQFGPCDTSLFLLVEKNSHIPLSSDSKMLRYLESREVNCISLADLRVHYLNYCR